jgi:D-aminoacyl-tRNA deacylase
MTPQSNPTIVLITSTEDPASTNIAGRLLERHGFESTGVVLFEKQVYQKDSLLLVTIDTRIVTPPDLDAYFNPQAYVFLSRHRAESGIASVTAHTTGNFTDDASQGGKPREIGRVNPDLLKNYMISLWKHSNELREFQVTIEATHHGPTSLLKPVLFVEIGSGDSSWRDERVGGIIADALMESLASGKTWDKVALGFGGTHYPDKFNKMVLETDTALASIAAKYALGGVDEPMFGQLIQKSTRFPRAVAIDWKGVGPHKERILRLAKQFGMEVIRL